MRNIRKITFNRLIICLLLPLLLIAFALSLVFADKKSANAMTTYPFDPTLDTPLYSYDTYSYDKAGLDELARAILDTKDTNTTIDTLIDHIYTKAGTSGAPVLRKDITVPYGRYGGITTGTQQANLVWMPVYMSTTRPTAENAKGDAVLTLYLASTNGPRSGQETSGITDIDLKNGNGKGQYTNDITCSVPSNMYGMSYIRAVTLGNGGKYASYDKDHSANYVSRDAAEIDAKSSHKYLDFLTYFEGEGVDKRKTIGYLYEDIVTPSQLVWQSYENYSESIGDKGVVTNGGGDGVNGGGADWKDYCFPNDAYDAPRDGAYHNVNFEYKNKKGYDGWINDKVWLPSLTEVGTGTDTALNGLWQLNATQRGNAKNGGASWLRTANPVYKADGNDYCTYTMFCAEENGTISTHKLDETNLAVRPAIHLNLSAALKKIDEPVVVPDVVNTVYNGEEQTLSDTVVTLPDSESQWFRKGEMHVEFFKERDCLTAAAPLNAGEYYMRVTLDRMDLYFVKCPRTQRSIVVKFVVAKAKLGIRWTYKKNVPTAVELAEGSRIYERDKLSGNVPKVGIQYESTIGSGETYYAFDDLLRGGYFGRAYIVDSDKYNYNYELDAAKGDPLESDHFEVGRKIITMPYFYGHESSELEVNISYAGEQYVQIANVSKYLNVEAKSTLEENKPVALGLSDDGYYTFKVTGVDKYTFEFTFVQSDYFTWPGDYNYSETGEDTGADEKMKSIVLNVNRAKIDVEFVGLPAEWNSITNPTFTLAVYGIYNKDGASQAPVSMRTYYQNDTTGKQNNLTAVAGVYTLSEVPQGEYTLYAIMNDPNYIKNYYMDPAYKMQKFKVVETVSTLSENDIKWQYTHNGTVSESFTYFDHETEDTALVFDYDDKNYVFSLTLDETTLHNDYYVKATYSGDIIEKNAGLHSVTVKITAFHKNVVFEPLEYTVYFKINPIKYDISALKWDYDPNTPPVYNGAAKKVRLTADSLATLPGLTATYSTDGDRIGAGDYVTTAAFQLSDIYAINYILPVATDENSYDGEFAFTCSWKITKAKLAIEWNEPAGDESGVLFVPTLKVGHSYVDYIYEHKESDGTWLPVEDLVAEGATETFRAIAVIKSAYANNYELDNDVPCEFEVASGKHPVSIHFEKDSQIIADGAEFPYSGTPVTLNLVVDSGGLEVKEYNFKYYSVDDKGAKTELEAAPSEVGKYAAVVTAKYGTDTYISEESASEISFNIVKADYDISQIYWIYKHGDKILAARFDSEQAKWVDESGKEVLFTFEYDGTPHVLNVECQQQFTNAEDKLSPLTVRGNSGTNADDYTAVVDFQYNDKHFNNPTPAFPRTLAWRITKKKINYNEVRWGYFDADGKERDFDFENDSFEFTRNESGVVGITVGLIGLPKGVQALISYETQDLVATDSKPVAGNTRSAVGEYLTTFTISGSWSDPNYEDFNAVDFPKTIPALRTWRIKRRELSKIDYKDGFTVFDDKVHNILELCNIPEEELVYFDVDITFVDSTGKNVYNNYAGYEDVKNMIYHAGTYDIRLYELVGEDATHVIWDFKSIEVKKWKLEVTWDKDGSYPIAKVTDLFASDKIGTKYYNMKDAEVPLAYVRSTNGEEQFYARPCVTEAYERDIEFTVKTDEQEVSFYYHTFTPTSSAKKFDYPEMEIASVEYTGEQITFSIKDWETVYKAYLYIADGNLIQTNVGEYRVLLRFYKDADAYWTKNSSTTEQVYNRDGYELTFTITPPTKWAVDFPVIENTMVKYTGEKITFTVDNWEDIKKYVTYEAFYKGASLGKTLTFTRGGKYNIVFSFPVESIGYWKERPNETTKTTYTIQLTIFGDLNEPLNIPNPKLDRVTAVHTGSALEFKLDGGADYLDYIEFEPCEGVEFNGGTITAVNEGTYSVKVKIKSGLAYTFDNGTTEYVLTFEITAAQSSEETIKLDKPVLDNVRQQLEGSEVTFTVVNWESYKDYLVLSCESEGVTITDGTIKVTIAGEYVLNISIKDGANAIWKDTNDTSVHTIRFFVVAKAEPGKVIKPIMLVDTKTYNGSDQTFELSDFNADEIEIVEGIEALTQKEVGTYTITLRLKHPKTEENPEGFTWQGTDNSTEDISITFTIVAAEKGKVVQPTMVSVSKTYNGKDQTFELNDFNADEVEIVEDQSDALTQREVKTYTVTLRLKHPKTEENPDGFVWQGTADSTDDIKLSFAIEPVKVENIVAGTDGKPVVADKDGAPVPDFDLDLGDLIDVEYYDEEGNKVDVKDLVAGKKYTVKFVVKDETKFNASIEGGKEISDKLTETNASGGFPVTYQPSGSQETPPDPNNPGGQETPPPADKDGESGFNPLWWIAIVLGVLAVIIVIVLLIVRARKNGDADDGYDDGYDDYDDDEYDDEDDDEYDDEDEDDYDDEY